MAALRLRDVVLSCDPGRAALLRLPVVCSSHAVFLSKPCIPPALGPRPTEAPCPPPPPPPNYHQNLRHVINGRHRNSYRDGQKLPRLPLSVNWHQKINPLSNLPNLPWRELPWSRVSNVQVEITPMDADESCCKIKHNAFPTQFEADSTHTTVNSHTSSTSLNSLIRELYSLDERQWCGSKQPVVLQQTDQLERAAETERPSSPQQREEEREQPQAERQPLQQPTEENQFHSDKATPAQMSFVLLKLREELPVFFDGHHSYHIYDANVTFENNLSSFSWSSHNRQSYRMFLESSRLALKCSFSQMELDLIKITKDVDQGKIEARWRVRGRPIYLLSLKERVLIEGFSTFLVNSSGLISLHKMDRVMPADLKEKERSPWLIWLRSLVGVATRKSPLPQPELINSGKYYYYY